MQIPVEVVPSHVHLSVLDYEALFGDTPASMLHRLAHQGQHATDVFVEVRGKLLRRSVMVHYVGPERAHTQVELTPTEAKYLGIQAPLARSGDMRDAGDCVLLGSKGKVRVRTAVIVPRPHLHCSVNDANTLRVTQGEEVQVELHLDAPRVLEGVVVRVHPTYALRLHVHADIAREHWITHAVTASLQKTIL